MARVVEIEGVSSPDRPPSPLDVASPATNGLVYEEADAQWAVLDPGGQAAAQCSLWWLSTPTLENHRPGLIGRYYARDAEAGKAILERACAVLADCGCTLAVGPMDGSTWSPYRFVTDRGTEPSFFLEPNHPNDWPGHFVNQGFEALAHYRSALNLRLVRPDRSVSAVSERLAAAGVSIRPIDPARLDDEMRGIHAVSLCAFTGSFLFTPIDEQQFMARYRELAARILPDLVLIAERRDRPVGFVFALPDWLQTSRGEPVDTVVIKSVAVVPDRTLAGLGRLLAWECEQRAASLGFTRSIHALMPERGKSHNISCEYAETMRGYTLFAKALR